MNADDRQCVWHDKVVVALASAPATAALAIVQVVGPGAAMLIAVCSQSSPPSVGRLSLLTLHDAEGHPIDRALVVCLCDTSPRFDISCHGGMRVVQRVMSRFVELGAERVDAMTLVDETYGVASLVAHDAYQCLPNARTLLAAECLLHQANGPLAEILDQPHLNASDRQTLKSAAEGFALSQRLLSGVTVAIVGPPNAGKSTLLNALADHDRALVADHPGTTRDAVHADVEIAGLAVTFVDTAGLGHTLDPLHDIVREKTLARIGEAQHVVLLLDAASSTSLDTQLAELLAIDVVASHHAAHRTQIVVNKCDAVAATPSMLADRSSLAISAKNDIGLDVFRASLIAALGFADFDPKTPRAFTAEQVTRIAKRLMQ